MSTPTQKLVARDIAARRETRRGTVLADPQLVAFDPAGIASFVYVIRVDIGQPNPIDGVIVKSMTGTGGRQYARAGAAVEIQRNEGGRWICVGPSDRVKSTGVVQLLDESTDTASSGGGSGLTSVRKAYSYYQGQLLSGPTPGTGRYGSKGYANNRIFDGNGNEVL